METNHPTLSALIRLHAAISGQIAENEKRTAKLAEDVKHIEAVIRLLSPSFNMKSIAQKRAYRGNPLFKHGTAFRAALEALRLAQEPLTVRQLAERILIAQGVVNWSSREIRNLQSALRASIPAYEKRGEIRRMGEGMPARWALKP